MRAVHISLMLLFVTAMSMSRLTGSLQPPPATGDAEFFALMKTVSDGWNEGNARKAADCFAENAVYMEPPDRQVYRGRKAIYEFFGGPNRPEPPLQMKWHHLAFNSNEHVGYGEYTFQGPRRYHGSRDRAHRGRKDFQMARVPIPIGLSLG